MIPAEYRSLRPSTLLDATCSGDMYCGVPTVVPVLVAVPPTPVSSVRRAMPKSATLTMPSSEMSTFSDEGMVKRSEEHTSELQSPYDLVCRLLLEKKKIENQESNHNHKQPLTGTD